MPVGLAAELSDLTLRVFIYESLLKRGGVPPRVAEIARHFGVSEDGARGALAALGIGKTVLVHPKTGEVWMAGPFASGETTYTVTAGPATVGNSTEPRRWWANCAWDMLGVAAIVDEPVRIDAACAECGEPITIELDPVHPPLEHAVVHFVVPAHRWYDDIGFT